MKILVSAGEVSGDVHGAWLVRELKKLCPEIYFFGLGSEKLRAEDVDIKFDLTKRGTIGLLETLPNLLPIFSIFQKTKKLLLKEKPNLVILIDSQGFNLPLAKFCQTHSIKTAYYIAPQEWLWGTSAGLKKVAETVDLIVAIFEKEYEIYKKAGANVVYFGQPLLDIVKPTMTREEFRKRLDLSHSALVIISLCPGSRPQEIKNLFPILLAASKIILKKIPAAHFLIPAASRAIYNEINSFIDHWSLDLGHYKVLEGKVYDALVASDLALCAAGTINLEASILGVPNIMVYKLSRLTYWLGKYFLKIDKKIKYFSMPNILLNEPVIPELVMGEARPEKIAAEALSILANPARQKNILSSFTHLRQKLGKPGVIAKIAKEILTQFQSLP